jgi:glycosyltransferase involved in cell wall biosynthesis
VQQKGLGAGPNGPGPLVTVLITNHNYGRYLRQAVDSALQQTYPRVEVLIVDDGSTDDSRTIIASYGDKLRAVYQDNGGQAKAVNAALPLVAGDILFVLDADD